MMTCTEMDLLAKRVTDHLVEPVAKRTAEIMLAMNDTLLSVKQCAQMLDISVEALRKRCEMKRIPYHKNGNRLYFFRQEVQEFIKNTTPASR